MALNEQIENYCKRFQAILEYTQVNGVLNEAEPEEGGDPMAGGDPMGGGDPMAGGGAPAGGDPMSGGDPMAGGGAPAGGEQQGQGVEGLNPQGGAEEGGDPMAGEDPMAGGDPMGDGDSMAPEAGDDIEDVDEMEEDDEVLDVDELTDYQQKTAKGVGKLSDELKALKKLITDFETKVDANNQGIEDLKRELQKRAPDAQERITLRQAKSGPFTQKIEDYWENNAPSNYKVSQDDEVDNPKYVITKNDIDGVSDWNNISKSFNEMAELNDLRNIFGI